MFFCAVTAGGWRCGVYGVLSPRISLLLCMPSNRNVVPVYHLGRDGHFLCVSAVGQQTACQLSACCNSDAPTVGWIYLTDDHPLTQELCGQWTVTTGAVVYMKSQQACRISRRLFVLPGSFCGRLRMRRGSLAAGRFLHFSLFDINKTDRGKRSALQEGEYERVKHEKSLHWFYLFTIPPYHVLNFVTMC